MRYPSRWPGGTMPEANRPPSLSIATLAYVTPEPVSWLWQGRIPRGKLCIIAGDPGVGKSYLSLDIAARVTRGAAWPDGCEGAGPADVVLVSGEDGIRDTIRPRMEKLEADLERAHVIGMRVETSDGQAPLSISEHIGQIEDALFKQKAALLVIDPLLSFLGRHTDSYKASEVRVVLNLLADVADRTGCAIIGIMHLNKRSGEGNVLYRLTASLDFAAAARAVIVVGPKPADPTLRVMAHAKSNLAPLPPSLEYRLAEQGVLEWAGQSAVSATELFTVPPATDIPALEEALQFLRDALMRGPRPAGEIAQEARELGINQTTLFRARKELGVAVARHNSGGARGNGRWMLALPSVQDCQLTYMGDDNLEAPHHEAVVQQFQGSGVG